MKKKVFAICGSTRAQSANLKLLRAIAEMTKDLFCIEIFEGLAQLPHFNPDLSIENTPDEVVAFRQKIAEADAVLVCTPEYVFSMPGSLKNALEWTVSTVVFSGKPAGLITASAGGKKGHAELKMVMKILGTKFNHKTCLLISSIKAKMDAAGNIRDEKTKLEVEGFVASFERLLK
ncbi:MAG: NAD(P)H-dependent oxidoreductase [Saprospiraceae bacterium]|nr:NAD(P)H-dependent oxidoreductase [Saprospiraceae bacterium]